LWRRSQRRRSASGTVAATSSGVTPMRSYLRAVAIIIFLLASYLLLQPLVA
jgi:hypothetical protein